MLSNYPINSRLVAFAASVVLSAGLAFYLPITDAYVGLRYGGWFFALTLLLLWLYYAVPALSMLWAATSHHASGAALGVIVVLLFSVAIFISEPAKFRILDDELSLQETSLSMHSDREFVTADKGYWIDGEFAIINATLGKRPFLYPFLVSLVHDLTGYRIENTFYLNFFLGLLVVIVAFWLFLYWFGVWASTIVSLALASSPVLILSIRSGGFEIANLLFIGVLGLALVVYMLRQESRRLEAFLIITAIILAYTRYESAILLPLILVFLLWRYWKKALGQLSWMTCICPLAMVPAVWLVRCTRARKGAWPGAEDVDVPIFSHAHIMGHLEDAAVFFLSPSSQVPTNFYFSLFGFLGLIGVLFLSIRTLPGRGSLSLGKLANEPGKFDSTGAKSLPAWIWLLLFIPLAFVVVSYFWSSFLDPLAQRMALPFFWVMAFGAAYFIRRLQVWAPWYPKLAGAVMLVGLFSSALPSLRESEAHYQENYLARMQNWKIELFQESDLQVESTLMIDPFPKAWTALRIPALRYADANQRLAALKLHQRVGTFKNMFVVDQLIRDEPGEWTTRRDALDPGIRLEDEAYAYLQLSESRAIRLMRVQAVEHETDLFEDFWSAHEGVAPAEEVLQEFKAFLAMNLP